VKRDQTPVLSVTFKPKARPRGKSFEPGNGFGSAYRFVKGAPSPNPGGRPKSKEINASARLYLGSDIGKPPKIQTHAQAIVHKIGVKAKKGDIGAATFLAERAEGRPATSVTVDGREDNLAILIGMMNDRSEQVGLPEGHVARQLKGADQDGEQ
jgi:hypothetical protein